MRARHRRQKPVNSMRRRSERGSVVVESALALPLFLLLIFGTMEFGLAFRTYLTLTNTTRDAARFAATLGRDADADYQVLNEAIANLGKGIFGWRVAPVDVAEPFHRRRRFPRNRAHQVLQVVAAAEPLSVRIDGDQAGPSSAHESTRPYA